MAISIFLNMACNLFYYNKYTVHVININKGNSLTTLLLINIIINQ